MKVWEGVTPTRAPAGEPIDRVGSVGSVNAGGARVGILAMAGFTACQHGACGWRCHYQTHQRSYRKVSAPTQPP